MSENNHKEQVLLRFSRDILGMNSLSKNASVFKIIADYRNISEKKSF